MKKYIWICSAVSLLGLGGLAFALSVLPDQVPMHWNAAGVMDRMGSKYELLILGLMAPLFAAFLLWVGKRCAKQPMEQKIVGWTAVSVSVLFWGITFFAIWAGYRYLQDPIPMNADLVLKGAGVLVGVTLIFLGNLMPKARRNPVFGIRMPWTMDSDAVWQRSQRFGGICAVVCGLAILLFAVLLPAVGSILATIVLSTVWAVLCLAVSWKYHREELEKRG